MSVELYELEPIIQLGKSKINIYLQHLHINAIEAICDNSSEMMVELFVKGVSIKYEKPKKFKYRKNIYIPFNMENNDNTELTRKYIHNIIIAKALEIYGELQQTETLEAIKLRIFNERTDLYIEFPIISVIVGNWQLNIDKI